MTFILSGGMRTKMIKILFYVFNNISGIYCLFEFGCSLLIYIYLAVSTCGIYNMLLVNGNEAEIFNSQNISGIWGLDSVYLSWFNESFDSFVKVYDVDK